MLLPVREDLPEAREELNPGPLSQRRGDVTQLDQSVQQRPRLTREIGGGEKMTAADSARQCFPVLGTRQRCSFTILMAS